MLSERDMDDAAPLLAAQDLLGQGLAQVTIDHAPQLAGSVLLAGAQIDEVLVDTVIQLEPQRGPAGGEQAFYLRDVAVDDLPQGAVIEAAEHHDVVEPVDQLGPEE